MKRPSLKNKSINQASQQTAKHDNETEQSQYNEKNKPTNQFAGVRSSESAESTGAMKRGPTRQVC